MSDTQDTHFKEELGSFFYDMLRAAGITMTPGIFPERVREIGVRMAGAIEHAAQRKAIEVIKQLQAAVLKGFEATEKEISALRQLALAQQKLLDELMLNRKEE